MRRQMVTTMYNNIGNSVNSIFMDLCLIIVYLFIYLFIFWLFGKLATHEIYIHFWKSAHKRATLTVN